jgi:hypothetical protein
VTAGPEPPDEECSVTGVLDDGTLVLAAGGRPERARIQGLDVPVPVPSGYTEIIMQRLAGTPLRCDPVTANDPPLVRLSYLAWQDQSGPVWRDLATVLLAEGAARVAAQPFPERDDYLRAEADARSRGAGIWAG